MTPQYLAGPDIHRQEFTQVATRLRILVIAPPDRTHAALAEHLLHRAEGCLLAVQRHGDVQRVGLRAEGHRSPILKSGRARAHLKLNTDLRNLQVSNLAFLWIDLHDVLVPKIRGVDERAAGSVELPQDTQLAHLEE